MIEFLRFLRIVLELSV